MTGLWAGIIVMTVGCFALKYAGLSVPEQMLQHPTMERAANLIPIALLGALISVQVFGDESSIVLDARLLALAVAAVLLMLRVPFLPVVVAAALAAALIRLI